MRMRALIACGLIAATGFTAIAEEKAREPVPLPEPVPETAASWRFSHALFWEAAYAGLAPGLRVRLHHRIAERLERQNRDHLEPVVTELAHHLHQSLALCDPEQALAHPTWKMGPKSFA